MEEIITNFCEGHEVLVAPTGKGNLVLVTIPKSFEMDYFIALISGYDLPDNPVYGVRYGKEEVRVII
ncbi:hypothetical protein HON71_05705 [Candidatus Woesearchaeota archaeon]|jgi:hypothetical protein|nr:hypothetical protein [Candidatus Woesearchaeota archaeon]MBT5342915.1 hypothetical protein [Candidatus Woesearchaeota archaeon]